MLIKGPVPPMVMGLAALALVIADRRWRWLGTTRPVTGLILALGGSLGQRAGRHGA